MPRGFKSELQERRASQDEVLVQLALDQLPELLQEVEDELAVVGGLGRMLGQVDRLAELEPAPPLVTLHLTLRVAPEGVRDGVQDPDGQRGRCVDRVEAAPRDLVDELRRARRELRRQLCGRRGRTLAEARHRAIDRGAQGVRLASGRGRLRQCRDSVVAIREPACAPVRAGVFGWSLGSTPNPAGTFRTCLCT